MRGRFYLDLGDPPLYADIDAPEPVGLYGHNAPSWMCSITEEVQRVHVMSPAAGGEVRSYWLARGALLHADCHPMDWPEVDAAVAHVTGLAVVGWKPVNDGSEGTRVALRVEAQRKGHVYRDG